MGTRKRAIDRKLKDVDVLEMSNRNILLDDNEISTN